MRLLFFGDVVGKSGREGFKQHLPALKERLRPDAVIVNVENAAAGHGVTEKLANDFFEWGATCLTTGNHVWAQKDFVHAIDRLPAVLRPVNFVSDTPGQGSFLYALPDGRTLLVVNAIARLFMGMLVDDPFTALDRLLERHTLGRTVNAVFVDFHGEATSEKMALAHYLDGRVSAVIGTHTHVPTCDEQILPQGTAYQTDAGMCGDYDSVIGVKKDQPIKRFTRHLPNERFLAADGKATVCGCMIETDDTSGLATRMERLQLGGRLRQTLP